jgi:hypothetical protein
MEHLDKSKENFYLTEQHGEIKIYDEKHYYSR